MTNPSDTWNLVRLLADVERRQLSGERDAALRESISACNALVEALGEALGQEPLRGLPNLGRGSRPHHVRRVRTDRLGLLDEREELCINARGELVMASSVNYDRYAREDDLMIGDAVALARTLTVALEQHLAATAQTSANYNEMRELSQRIVKLVKGE